MTFNIMLFFPSVAPQQFQPLRRVVVFSCRLEQRLSACFELELRLGLEDPQWDFTSVMGHQVSVGFDDEPFLTEVHGFVRSVEQLTTEPAGLSRYKLIVVPPLWMTTEGKAHRIYQHLCVPEIVAGVIRDYRGAIPALVSACSGDHRKREYTVQYGETNHDFIFRLLADEGIASFFDHDNGGAFTLVDDTTLFTPALEHAVSFVPPGVETADRPHIQSVRVESNLTAAAAVLRDYAYENPQFTLQAQADTASGIALYKEEAGLGSYEYQVGKFRAEKDGSARAAQLLQEARTRSRLLHCACSFGIAPGTRLCLVDHPRGDLNRELLVIRSTMLFDAEQSPPVLNHCFTAMPASSLFRPPRWNKPRIHGTQTAFVVGAPGQEIDVDELGRVEVQFRWDRRDLGRTGASRRIRVSQGWAGTGFGLTLLPRVGDEVIVSYLDGDPDEPIIVGRVHNATAVPPLQLPAYKTQSVWRSRSTPNSDGFNQILMEDTSGRELLALRAQRDLLMDAVHDSWTRVGADQSTTVMGRQNITIMGGQSTKVGAGHTVGIDGDSQTLVKAAWNLIAGIISTTAHGDHLQITDGNFIGHAKEYSIHAGGATLTITGQAITLELGASKIIIAADKITITSPLIELNP